MSTLAFLNLSKQSNGSLSGVSSTEISGKGGSFKSLWHILCKKRIKHMSVLVTKKEYQVVGERL